MQETIDRLKEVQQLVVAINAAYKEMVEEKMLLGRDIVTSDNEGNIRIEPASEYYKRVYTT